jgi:hypothetical protein
MRGKIIAFSFRSLVKNLHGATLDKVKTILKVTQMAA